MKANRQQLSGNRIQISRTALYLSSTFNFLLRFNRWSRRFMETSMTIPTPRASWFYLMQRQGVRGGLLHTTYDLLRCPGRSVGEFSMYSFIANSKKPQSD